MTIDWALQGSGFVADRSTPERRRIELAYWEGDPWYDTLAELIPKLEALDPDFSLDQVKEKFGSLRVYISRSKDLPPDVVDKMRRLVNHAEMRCRTR